WQANEKSPSTAELNSAPGPLIVRGFLSNVFNPKSVLFFVSVVPTFVGISPGQPNFPFQMAIFGIVYVAIATAVPTRARRSCPPFGSGNRWRHGARATVLQAARWCG